LLQIVDIRVSSKKTGRVAARTGRALVLALALLSLIAPARAQSAADLHALNARLVMPLPDAPLPAEAASSSDAGSPTSLAADDDSADAPHFLLSSSQSKYSTVVKPGQDRVPFTAKEKFIFSMRESVSPEQAFVVTLSAGYNHLIDGNPHFGSDGNGFGEREGSAALREASVHLLGDGVFATAFHQDPRYFRVGPGTRFSRRVRHVLIASVTSHADSDGRLQPDYSGLLGRAVTAGETLGYYPHVSATGKIAAETFGYSVLGEVAGNGFLEFWPDLVHRHAER
jgi:hypothetical protein